MRKLVAAITVSSLVAGSLLSSASISPTHNTGRSTADGLGAQPFAHVSKIADGLGAQPFAATSLLADGLGAQPFAQQAPVAAADSESLNA